MRVRVRYIMQAGMLRSIQYTIYNMRDTGYRILDTGYWILDTAYSTCTCTYVYVYLYTYLPLCLYAVACRSIGMDTFDILKCIFEMGHGW